jgi:organic radical activating enzyme
MEGMNLDFMKANEKELEIIVTYKCNWNCEYCCVDTHNQPAISSIELQNKVKLVHEKYNDYNITLSGGEVGTLSLEKILYLLEEFEDYNLSLNTNGLFLEKYPSLIDKFNSILYHASENLDTEIIKDLPGNVQYMIVVTDNNFHNLESFLDNNNRLFHIVPGSLSLEDYTPQLSKANHKLLLKNYRTYATIESQLRWITEKDFDNIVYI